MWTKENFLFWSYFIIIFCVFQTNVICLLVEVGGLLWFSKLTPSCIVSCWYKWITYTWRSFSTLSYHSIPGRIFFMIKQKSRIQKCIFLHSVSFCQQYRLYPKNGIDRYDWIPKIQRNCKNLVNIWDAHDWFLTFKSTLYTLFINIFYLK